MCEEPRVTRIDASCNRRTENPSIVPTPDRRALGQAEPAPPLRQLTWNPQTKGGIRALYGLRSSGFTSPQSAPAHLAVIVVVELRTLSPSFDTEVNFTV
jgi:hypothetical protein